jgi:hypothetical protein
MTAGTRRAAVTAAAAALALGMAAALAGRVDSPAALALALGAILAAAALPILAAGILAEWRRAGTDTDTAGTDAGTDPNGE